jgi:hypothetical protein
VRVDNQGACRRRAERSAQAGQSLPEAMAGPRIVAVVPQERGERRATMPLAWMNRQVREEGRGLPRG